MSKFLNRVLFTHSTVVDLARRCLHRSNWVCLSSSAIHLSKYPVQNAHQISLLLSHLVFVLIAVIAETSLSLLIRLPPLPLDIHPTMRQHLDDL